MREITIIGGGHLGHALAAVLAAEANVTVLSRRPWPAGRRLVARAEGVAVIAQPVRATSDPGEALAGAELVITALPAYAHGPALRTIAAHAPADAWVGAAPATGLFHDRARRILGRGRRIFGLRESPFNCRVAEHGSTVDILGVVPEMAVAAYDRAESGEIAGLLARLLGIPCRVLTHPLPISLRPLNIAFHPARLFSLFGGCDVPRTYRSRPLFYEDWDDRASHLYLACSDELERLAGATGLFDPMEIEPVWHRYGTREPSELTRRIRQLPGLRGIEAPMTASEDGLIPDVRSRYFREDIGVGLVLARRLASASGLVTVTVAEIVAWWQTLTRNLRRRRGSGPAAPPPFPCR